MDNDVVLIIAGQEKVRFALPGAETQSKLDMAREYIRSLTKDVNASVALANTKYEVQAKELGKNHPYTVYLYQLLIDALEAQTKHNEMLRAIQ